MNLTCAKWALALADGPHHEMVEVQGIGVSEEHAILPLISGPLAALARDASQLSRLLAMAPATRELVVGRLTAYEHQ